MKAVISEKRKQSWEMRAALPFIGEMEKIARASLIGFLASAGLRLIDYSWSLPPTQRWPRMNSCIIDAGSACSNSIFACTGLVEFACRSGEYETSSCGNIVHM